MTDYLYAKYVNDINKGGLKIMVTKKGYDWKKTLKKIGVVTVYVILAGLAANYGDNQYYLMVAPLLIGLQNLLKHKFNISLGL